MSVDRHHRHDLKKEKKLWTPEETEAVLRGVERWGKGKWSSIKDDPDFGPILVDRTTIDIKDKYRNLFAKHRTSASARTDSPKPVISKADALNLVARNALDLVESKPPKASTERTPTSKRIKRGTPEAALAESPIEIKEAKKTELKPFKPTTTPTTAAAADSMMLTLVFQKRSYVLNLKGATKASQLLAFARKEFNLDGDYELASTGIEKNLDLAKTLREQIPMFDLLKLVKI